MMLDTSLKVEFDRKLEVISERRVEGRSGVVVINPNA